VICCQDGCFKVRQRRIAQEYLNHNLDEHCVEDTRMTWCLCYPSGGALFSRVRNNFLGPMWLIGCSPPAWSRDLVRSSPHKKERKKERRVFVKEGTWPSFLRLSQWQIRKKHVLKGDPPGKDGFLQSKF